MTLELNKDRPMHTISDKKIVLGL